MFPPFWESRWEGSHSLLHCPWNFNEYCFGLFQKKLLKIKQSVPQDTTERKKLGDTGKNAVNSNLKMERKV